MKRPPAHPALAAIAAVLALASTPALAQAQTVEPSAAATPVVAPPAVEITPAPVQLPQTAAPALAIPSIVTQSERQVTTQIAPDSIAPVPRTERAAPVARTAAPQRQAEPVAAVSASPNMASELADDPAVVPGSEFALPETTPPETTPVVSPVIDTPQPTVAADDNISTILLLAAGLAGALGIAAAAPMLIGRRKRIAREDAQAPVVTEMLVDTPAARARAAALAPVVAPVPARVEPRQTVSSVLARSGTMTDDLLTSFVNEPPSAENPFLTRKNRMRRARFILAQHNVTPVSAKPEIAVSPPVKTPVLAKEQMQTVYDFGRSEKRTTWLKPATN